MSISHVVSPQDWLAARRDLLVKEKQVTRAKDAVDAARRGLPMAEVTKDYTFTGPGRAGEPGRLVRGASAADHLPLHVAARRVRFPGRRPGLSDLLVPGRRHRPPVPPARLRYHAGAGVPGADRQHRAVQEAMGCAVVLLGRQRFQLRLPRRCRDAAGRAGPRRDGAHCPGCYARPGTGREHPARGVLRGRPTRGWRGPSAPGLG
jgi:Bacterial protein of unknown function (DUF899)